MPPRPNRILQLARGLTVSLFFRPTAAMLAHQGSLSLASRDTDFALKLVLAGGKARVASDLMVGTTTRAVQGPELTLEADKWYQVAVVASTTALILYFEGEEIARETFPSVSTQILRSFGTESLRLGIVPNALGSATPALFLDEFRMTYGRRTEESLRSDAGFVGAIQPVPQESQLPKGLDTRDVSYLVRAAGYTQAQADLGKELFEDKRLSSDNTVACSSCHLKEFGYADNRALSTGVRNGQPKRNTPTILNASHLSRFMADGRALGSVAQVGLPITSAIEMGRTLGVGSAAADLLAKGYGPKFAMAELGGVDGDSIRKALAAFQSSLYSGDSPVDRYLAGEEGELSDLARKGLALFRGRAGCSGCHSGSNCSDDSFHNTGFFRYEGTATEVHADLGRIALTGIEGDRGAFRTPTLREVGKTAPYMHDGSVPTLRRVVQLYNIGGGFANGRDPGMMVLGLDNEDVNALVAFLEALSTTGELQPKAIQLGGLQSPVDPVAARATELAKYRAFVQATLPGLVPGATAADVDDIAKRMTRVSGAPLPRQMQEILLSKVYATRWTARWFGAIDATRATNGSVISRMRRAGTAKAVLAELAADYLPRHADCANTPTENCYKYLVKQAHQVILGRAMAEPDWDAPNGWWDKAQIYREGNSLGDALGLLAADVANSAEAHRRMVLLAAADLGRTPAPDLTKQNAAVAYARLPAMPALSPRDLRYNTSWPYGSDSYEKVLEFLLLEAWNEMYP